MSQIEPVEETRAESRESAAVWNVPYPRNANFTGRAQALAAMHQGMNAKSAIERVQIVIGEGGIGKTQLAVEFAYKHRWEYEIIWWLPADDVASLTLHYARLGQALGLKFSEDTSSEDIRAVVRGVLAQRGKWLLIFDNAITNQQIRDFLPPRPLYGHAIITSRNPNWTDVGTIVPLGPLKRGESIVLLRKRTGRNDPNEAASKLAQALGDLPIALNQAAAVIERSKIGFLEYLQQFEALWAELLQRGIRLADHPDAVAMAWELSIRQAEAKSPAAVDLLNLCAFFASVPIARSFLSGSALRVPPQLQDVLEDALNLESAIAALRSYSMAEADENAITVHPMVSAAARQRLDRDARRRWIDAAVRCVAGAFFFQSDDITTWSGCGELLPHALVAAEFGEAEDVALAEVAELLDNAGRYVYRIGQLVQARDLLTRAMRIHERVSGISHPKVAAVANDLGRVLTRLGEHQQAQECFERALTIDQSTYGIDDPHTATVVNNYGMALHACGDRIGAKEQFEVALHVYERHYGYDHPKTASVLNNLGCVLQEIGELELARQHFERALEITRASCGPAHPKVASILGNLGNVRRATGQFHQALLDLQQVLQIDESAYGRTHPDVARDLGWLGAIFESTAQLEDARRCYERAVQIDESVYGPAHPLLVNRLNTLGRLLKSAGEIDASELCFARAATILAENRKRNT